MHLRLRIKNQKALSRPFSGSEHQRNNNDGEGLYGVKEYYTRASAHVQWIEKIKAASNKHLSKIALKRPRYKVINSTKNETIALMGRYSLTDGTDFFY